MTIEEVIKSGTELPLHKKVVLNLIYTQHVIAEKFSDLLKPFDISSEQFNVLRILRGQKGKPANMSLIQERMVAKTSNTTRLVDKLLLKGLVTREVCPENRRKIEVCITEKGLALLAQLDPLVEGYDQECATKFTPAELEQLNDFLERFRASTTLFKSKL